MIAIPLLDGDTFLCDNSTMEKFTTCPRSAQYAISYRLTPSGDRSALKFGGIAHKVLDTRYRAGTPMLEQNLDVTNAMVAVAEKEFSTYTPPQDDFRNLDRMVDLIHKYGQAYPFESFDLYRFPDGRPFIEVPFMVPLGEIDLQGATFYVQNLVKTPNGELVKSGTVHPRTINSIKIVWMGRIDLAYTLSSGLYIVDHKTSSIATNMAEFEISHQFYGYTYATETLLQREVNGIVINRIVCRKPTRTGEAFTFERKLIPVARGLVAEWRTDCLHIIADYIEMVRRQYLPKHTSWCVGKFGTCPFHKVCQLDSEDQRDVMLWSGEYQEATWSPLAEQA